MIICSCNVLREADLKKACTPEMASAEQLYACLGCKPECGKCLDYVEAFVMPLNAAATRSQ